MGSTKKPSKIEIAKHALKERLNAISTAALQARDAVESTDDDWADDVSEFLETIDHDMEIVFSRLEPFLEDPDDDGEGGEGEHPNQED